MWEFIPGPWCSPLIYMSFLMPVPHCLDYYSFVASFETGSMSLPTLFFFFKMTLAILGPSNSHMHFGISQFLQRSQLWLDRSGVESVYQFGVYRFWMMSYTWHCWVRGPLGSSPNLPLQTSSSSKGTLYFPRTELSLHSSYYFLFWLCVFALLFPSTWNAHTHKARLQFSHLIPRYHLKARFLSSPQSEKIDECPVQASRALGYKDD